MIRIRCSGLPMYLDCPRRSACNLFDDQIADAGFHISKRPVGVAAAVGTGTHDGAAYIAENLIRTESRGKLEHATERAIVKYRDQIAAGVEFDDTTPNNNHAEKQISTLTRSYFHEIAPRLNLVNGEVEQYLKAQINNFMVSGHVDLADDRQVRDLKTGRVGSYHAQVGGYSLVRRSNGAPAPTEIFIDYLPRVPISKPYPGAAVQEYNVSVCEKAAFETIKIIQRDVNNFISSGGNEWAFPANPKSSLCSPRYCAAWGSDFCALGGSK